MSWVAYVTGVKTPSSRIYWGGWEPPLEMPSSAQGSDRSVLAGPKWRT